jgi:hypothetical protein
MNIVRLSLLTLLTAIGFFSYDCYGMSYGVATGEDISEFYTEFYDEGWAVGTQSYVEGGLTFNYPESIFSGTPTVVVSVELLSAYDSGTAYIAQAIDNTSSSVTVYVTEITSSSIAEASTGSVNVHVWAVGPTND